MTIKRIILTILPLALPLYVVRFHLGPLPTTLLEVIVIACFVAWILRRFRTQNSPPLYATRFLLPAGLWLVAGTIAVFVAQNHSAALGLWRAYFLEPILVFIMLADLIQTPDDRRVLFRSVIIALIGVSVYAILQRIGILPIPAPWDVPPNGIRASGPFPFPNALALFAAPIAALCFGTALQDRPQESSLPRLLLWLGFGAGLVAVILAKSAGGIIAICAAVFVTLLLRRKTRLIAIGGSVAIILFILAIPSIRQPVTQKIFFDAWSGKVRLVMWKETWAMLLDHPMFGAGLGAYPDAIKPYHTATWMEIFQYPHNILLNLWSETGLLGIVAFAWILWTWLRRKDTWHISLPVILALLVHGLVDVPYFKNDLALLFWILIALTINTRRV